MRLVVHLLHLPHRQQVGWPILYGFIVKGGLSSEARPSFPNPTTSSPSKLLSPGMRLVVHLLHLTHRQQVGWPILYGFIVKGGLSSEARPSFPNPTTSSPSKLLSPGMRLVVHLLHLTHRQQVGWPILYGFIVKGGLSSEARPSFPNPTTSSPSKLLSPGMRLVVHLLHLPDRQQVGWPILYGFIVKGGLSSEARPSSLTPPLKPHQKIT